MGMMYWPLLQGVLCICKHHSQDGHWEPVLLLKSRTDLQVARCTKIIKPGTEEAKYVINVKQIAKVKHFLACLICCIDEFAKCLGIP